MEINDFDKIIKEQMKKMEVAPSASVKKSLAFKLFFNNLIVFHKIKLLTVLLLLLISGSVYVGTNYTSASENSVSQKEDIILENDIATLEINSEETQTSSKENNSSNTIVQTTGDSELLVSSEESEEGSTGKDNNETSNISNNYSNEVSSSIEKGDEKSESYNNKQHIASNEDESTQTDEVGNVEKLNNNSVVINNEEPTNEIEKNTVVSKNENKPFALHPDESLVDEIVTNDVKDIEKVSIIPGGIKTEIVADNMLPSPVVVKPFDDYANDPKKRGLTIDGYFSPFNKVDIDNSLNSDLQEYHWDFYKEHGYVNTGVSGGLNINYNWNNFKIGTGLQLIGLRDYKSKYEYFYLPGYQGVNGGQSISGAVVYGEDTTLVFHANPADVNLHEEIEKEYNEYRYLKIPLTLGYELDFKYFSFELNGGVEYGRLVKTNGVEVKNGEVVNDPYSIYFYQNKYIDMMSRKSENLNQNQLAILANATLRVRLSPSFDLYSSFNYTQGKKGIYNEGYFLQKTYKNYGAKIGVTYYLNKRLKLKETTSISF